MTPSAANSPVPRPAPKARSGHHAAEHRTTLGGDGRPPRASPPEWVPAGTAAGTAEAAAAERESISARLAKNLVAARLIAELTQFELASASGVSRATIAQLEAGDGDPRLSTVVDLAGALGIPPTVLLLGTEDLVVLDALVPARADTPPGAAAASRPLDVPHADLARMRHLVGSGMLKDRYRAAQLGAEVARRGGLGEAPTPMIVGLLSAMIPGRGTLIGAMVGQALSRGQRR